jgi:hypothetical protein
LYDMPSATHVKMNTKDVIRLETTCPAFAIHAFSDAHRKYCLRAID